MMDVLREFLDIAEVLTVRGIEEIIAFFRRDWSMAEKILIILCCILLGMVKGFKMAKIKQGIMIGSNNGNYNGDRYDQYELSEEE